MSNFEKVKEFNESFGVTVHNNPQKNIVVEDPELTKLRLDLILEEVSELKEAVKTNDFTEIVDALSDILYVVYGAGVSFGVNLDKSFDIVHKSNMSKLCKTEKEAEETVEWYKDKFSKKELPYDSPSIRKSNDDKYWVVYNKSTGKILKSIGGMKVLDYIINRIKNIKDIDEYWIATSNNKNDIMSS